MQKFSPAQCTQDFCSQVSVVYVPEICELSRAAAVPCACVVCDGDLKHHEVSAVQVVHKSFQQPSGAKLWSQKR